MNNMIAIGNVKSIGIAVCSCIWNNYYHHILRNIIDNTRWLTRLNGNWVLYAFLKSNQWVDDDIWEYFFELKNI